MPVKFATDGNVPAATNLPARRIDSAGRARVDHRDILALALPLMLNNAIQIILNLTDVWFIGHISTKALAAVGAVQWLILIVVVIFGSVALAVQTTVAQAYGARRYRRAAQALWNALWVTVCTVPVYVVIGAMGQFILQPFDLEPDIEHLASDFWFPRVGGASLGSAAWVMLGFFSGIGRPLATVLISIGTVSANAVLNDLFIFQLGWGVTGSAWASTMAQGIGLILAIAVFLSTTYRHIFCSHLTWRPRPMLLLEQVRLGFPMGLLPAGDLLGFSLFQIMQVRFSTIDGAAAQLITMLASLSYVPGVGIALAGTTLVGQSIGAGNRDWAFRLGTHVILLVTFSMGAVGIILVLCGPHILGLLIDSRDPNAVAAVTLGTRVLWIASAYQLFEGLNLGSGYCLRGAGDATVPGVLSLSISWLIFVPLVHSFTFGPGQGWVNFLPQFGWGLTGGWIAVLIYIMLLGTTLFLRWRSRAWQKFKITSVSTA